MLKQLFCALTLLYAAAVTAEPTQVFVVRHAERAPEPKDDPAISPEGIARAELLAEMLAAANVRTIITTNYRRTQETAAPLAKRTGVTPIPVAIRRGELAAHINEVVAEARKSSGVVLVVGHSKTVAAIVAGLSSSTPVRLCETSFSNMFIATPTALSLPAAQLKFGRPDLASTVGCQ